MIGQDYIANKVEADLFPQGEEAVQQESLKRRRRKGSLWLRAGFFWHRRSPTIVILSILLLKISERHDQAWWPKRARFRNASCCSPLAEAQVHRTRPTLLLATASMTWSWRRAVAEDPNGLWVSYPGAPICNPG
jgi:hypothetical protein